MPRYAQHGQIRRGANNPGQVNFIMRSRLDRQQRTVRARDGNPSTVPPHPVPDSMNSAAAIIRARQQKEDEEAEQEAQAQRLEAAQAVHQQAIAQNQHNIFLYTPPRQQRPRESLRPHKRRSVADRSRAIFQTLRNLFQAYRNPALPLAERNLKAACALRWTHMGYLRFKCAELCTTAELPFSRLNRNSYAYKPMQLSNASDLVHTDLSRHPERIFLFKRNDQGEPRWGCNICTAQVTEDYESVSRVKRYRHVLPRYDNLSLTIPQILFHMGDQHFKEASNNFMYTQWTQKRTRVRHLSEPPLHYWSPSQTVKSPVKPLSTDSLSSVTLRPSPTVNALQLAQATARVTKPFIPDNFGTLNVGPLVLLPCPIRKRSFEHLKGFYSFAKEFVQYDKQLPDDSPIPGNNDRGHEATPDFQYEEPLDFPHLRESLNGPRELRVRRKNYISSEMNLRLRMDEDIEKFDFNKYFVPKVTFSSIGAICPPVLPPRIRKFKYVQAFPDLYSVGHVLQFRGTSRAATVIQRAFQSSLCRFRILTASHWPSRTARFFELRKMILNRAAAGPPPPAGPRIVVTSVEQQEEEARKAGPSRRKRPRNQHEFVEEIYRVSKKNPALRDALTAREFSAENVTRNIPDSLLADIDALPLHPEPAAASPKAGQPSEAADVLEIHASSSDQSFASATSEQAPVQSESPAINTARPDTTSSVPAPGTPPAAGRVTGTIDDPTVLSPPPQRRRTNSSERHVRQLFFPQSDGQSDDRGLETQPHSSTMDQSPAASWFPDADLRGFIHSQKPPPLASQYPDADLRDVLPAKHTPPLASQYPDADLRNVLPAKRMPPLTSLHPEADLRNILPESRPSLIARRRPDADLRDTLRTYTKNKEGSPDKRQKTDHPSRHSSPSDHSTDRTSSAESDAGDEDSDSSSSSSSSSNSSSSHDSARQRPRQSARSSTGQPTTSPPKDDNKTPPVPGKKPSTAGSRTTTTAAARKTPPLPPSPPPMPPSVDTSGGNEPLTSAAPIKKLKTPLWHLAQNLLEARPTVKRDPPPNAYQPAHHAMEAISDLLKQLRDMEATAWTAAQATKSDPSIFRSQASSFADRARAKLLVLSNQLNRIPAGGNYAILTPTHARTFQWIATRDRRAVITQVSMMLNKPDPQGKHHSNYTSAIKLLKICNDRWQNMFFEEHSLPAENPTATARSSADIAADAFSLPSNEFTALHRAAIQAITPEIAEKMQQQHLRERLYGKGRAAQPQPRPAASTKSVRAVPQQAAPPPTVLTGAKPKVPPGPSSTQTDQGPSLEEMSQLHTAKSDIWKRINQMNKEQEQQQQRKLQREQRRQSREQQQKQQSSLQGAHSSSRAGFSQIVHSGMTSIVEDIAGTSFQTQHRPSSTPRALAAARPAGVIAARTRSMSTDQEEPDTTEQPSSAARRALGLVKKRTKKQPRN